MRQGGAPAACCFPNSLLLASAAPVSHLNLDPASLPLPNHMSPNPCPPVKLVVCVHPQPGHWPAIRFCDFCHAVEEVCCGAAVHKGGTRQQGILLLLVDLARVDQADKAPEGRAGQALGGVLMLRCSFHGPTALTGA